MDVVEKTRSVCQICYLHGNITDMDTPIFSATPRLPVDNKLHYHTMPMKWLSLNSEIRLKIQGGLSTPNVSMISLLHTHTKRWQPNAKLQAASITFGKKTHQVHCTHQDSNTHHILAYFLSFYIYVRWFLSMPSSGFQPFDTNWRYFDVPLMILFRPTFSFRKYLRNAQLLIPANLKIHNLQFSGFSISPSVLDQNDSLISDTPPN